MLSYRTKKRFERQPLESQDGDGMPLVLVAEDHDDTRALYRYVLEARHYRVVDAKDGEEAVSLAEHLHPNLILMDTSLPLIDGLMATDRIRKLLNEYIPIIFVSGNAHPRLKREALNAGGDEYLVKPVSLEELEAAVERLLTINGVSRSRNARAV